jgi:hypothetical protein
MDIRGIKYFIGKILLTKSTKYNILWNIMGFTEGKNTSDRLNTTW